MCNNYTCKFGCIIPRSTVEIRTLSFAWGCRCWTLWSPTHSCIWKPALQAELVLSFQLGRYPPSGLPGSAARINHLCWRWSKPNQEIDAAPLHLWVQSSSSLTLLTFSKLVRARAENTKETICERPRQIQLSAHRLIQVLLAVLKPRIRNINRIWMPFSPHWHSIPPRGRFSCSTSSPLPEGRM